MNPPLDEQLVLWMEDLVRMPAAMARMLMEAGYEDQALAMPFHEWQKAKGYA